MVLVLGIVKASLEILGIGIGVKKVVLLMSGPHVQLTTIAPWRLLNTNLFIVSELARPP